MIKKRIFKKILIILIFIFMIFGCNKNAQNNLNSIKVSDDKLSSLNITINNKEYTIILEDNDTVKEFASILPKKLTMKELNGNEKYVYLDETLVVNPSNVKTINAGDVMIYGNNCLVIFYKTFNTSYSYTKIGHIDNLPDLGNNDISVEINGG